MAGPRYTIDELVRLRESPLVQRPDRLPSIEEWLDQPQEPGQRKPRTQSGRQEEPAPMGNFASQRPTLGQTRQHPSRTGAGEDIVLGPPKTAFSSSRNLGKLADLADKTSSPAAGDDVRADEPASARSRFFRERETERGQPRNTYGAPAKERESWGAARGGGRTFGDHDARGAAGDRERYSGRNQRERGDRAFDNEDDASDRRNGYGHKQDNRWARDADRGSSKMQSQGQERVGWREREKRNDREWDNKGGPTEREPEWMAEPATKEDDQVHSVDEYERWKASMKAAKAPQGEKENVEMPLPDKTLSAAKDAAPLPIETGFNTSFFGTWADNKRPDAPVESTPTPTQPPPAKGKSSRFASMFAPREEVQRQIDTPASPVALTPAANESSEDKAAFQNVMSMLRGTSVGPQTTMPLPTLSSHPLRSPANMANPGPSEPNQFMQPQSPDDGPRGVADNNRRANEPNRAPSGFAPDSFFGQPTGNGHRASRVIPSNVVSLEPPGQAVQSGDIPLQARPQEMRSIFLEDPPRNVSTPEAKNIQSLLAGQRPPKSAGLNKDSEFLLNLIQTKNANRTPAPSRPPPEQDNFQLFLDQPAMVQTHAPKPRAPPGFREEQLFPQRDQAPPGMEKNVNRRSMQRAPPGFFDDPSIVQQSQRHYPSEQQQLQQQGGPPRRSSIHQGPLQGPLQGPPGQFAPEYPPFFNGQPPQHLQAQQGPQIQQAQNERLSGPPPGFLPNMRHPQGLANMPNIFQQASAQPPNGHNQQMQGQMPLPPPSQLMQQQQQQRRPPPMQLDNSQPGGFGMPPPGFFGPPPPGHAHPHALPGLPPGFGPMHLAGNGMMPPRAPSHEGLNGMMHARSPSEVMNAPPQQMQQQRGFDAFGGGLGQGQGQGPRRG